MRPSDQSVSEWLAEYNLTGETAMSLTMKNEGGDFELLPEGTHIAKCYIVADLGDQVTTYKGVESVKPQVLISWEIPNELMSDGRPFVASKIYSAFFSERANLRKHLESWRGRKFTEEELSGFDISKLLNVPCQVTITHSQSGDKTYTNVDSVTGLPKGVECPDLKNEPVMYDLDNPDEESFNKLPEWVQKKIAGRVQDNVEEFPDSKPTAVSNDFDDDIPFAPRKDIC